MKKANALVFCLSMIVALVAAFCTPAIAHPFPDEPVEVYYHGHYIKAWYHYHPGLHQVDIPGYGEMWIHELLPDE
jgi:hypothetical protein